MKRSLIYKALRLDVWLCLVWFIFPLQVFAQALPEWSAEDRARIKKSELIAGAGLLIDTPTREKELKQVAVVELLKLPEEEQDLGYDPEIIPEDFLDQYFAEVPEAYLIDPQQLLSKQEALDREGFLKYHASEAKVDIKLYLFDAKQLIPDSYSLRRLVQERYEESELTAVVFFFLGDPSRNMLAFGGESVVVPETSDTQRMLENAKLKAMEKSDPAAQIEAFVVELSIKLYWLEQEMLSVQTKGSSELDLSALVSSTEGVKGRVGKSSELLVQAQPYILYIAVGTIGIVLSFLAVIGLFLLWKKGRRYTFPVLEVPQRLGADYAAGIGAVVTFHNKYGSPANQRNQVPDYLTRL